MADGKSRFLALLDERGVLPDDPLRNATPQMLQGGNPNELLAAAIKRAEIAKQRAETANQPQPAPVEKGTFEKLKQAGQEALDAVNRSRVGNVVGKETDSEKAERHKKEGFKPIYLPRDLNDL